MRSFVVCISTHSRCLLHPPGNQTPRFYTTVDKLPIRLKLPEKYGDGSSEYDEHCLVLMRAAHPKLSDTFEQCKKNRDKDKNGLAPSRDLLDYTYPRDLFTLIFAEWDGLFKSIFGKQPKKNKEYWNDISELLTAIRNPLAHHRVDSLSASLYADAKRACEEILASIKVFEETIRPS